MWKTFAACALLLVTVAACEPTSPPGLADLGLDPGPADVPGDASPEVPTIDPGADGTPPDAAFDPGPGNDAPADLPPPDLPSVDAAGDAPSDLPPGDTGPDACLPVPCAMWCEFGFANGPDGCPVCGCRDCAVDADCDGVGMSCGSPACTPEGACVCDCSGTPPVPYTCPDGTPVPHGACDAQGWAWLPHPERACPTLCVPGQTDVHRCADGSEVPWCTCAQDDSCRPVCSDPGDGSTAWVDPCTGQKVSDRSCTVGRVPTCTFIGTRSEGWYDGEGLVSWAACGPVRTCDPAAADACASTRCTTADAAFPWTCPDGTPMPFCACDVPAAKCPPECRAAGTKSEGWYDACTGALLKYDTCDGCTAGCDKVGSKSEGWYSSCNGLVGWAMCATGEWTCAAAPWDACTGHAGPGAGALGRGCGTDADCAADLLCLSTVPAVPPGVCSKVCNPMSMSPVKQCPDGFECVPVPEHQAPGFCLPACKDDTACPAPLTCGSLAGAGVNPAACFDW